MLLVWNYVRRVGHRSCRAFQILQRIGIKFLHTKARNLTTNNETLRRFAAQGDNLLLHAAGTRRL